VGEEIEQKKAKVTKRGRDFGLRIADLGFGIGDWGSGRQRRE
jgi:hypothetical protein